MDKRINKRLAVALTGILMSGGLSTSLPSYAENNEEIEPELSTNNLNERNTTKKGKVTTSSLNVRANASTNSSRIGSLKKGTIVEIENISSNGWYKIKYKKGYGYVSGKYIEILNDSSTDTTVIKKGKINTNTLNVRSEASASSSKIGTLSKGTIVDIVKIEKNGWYKIKYKKGYGYISGSYVVDVDSEDNGSSNDTTVIKKGKINTTTLNVRSEASASSSKIGTLSKGTIVEIVKIEKNGWYKIKYKKGYGYISGSYVVDVDSEDNGSSNDTTVIKKGKINTTTLNVRSEASASSSKIGTLSKGTIVEIVKIEKNGWYKIKYKKGYGYISGSYVVDVDSEDNGSSNDTTVIKKGKINTTTLNVRSEASASSSKIGTLSKGTIVEIVKIEKNGWYKIKYKKGYGYISGSYVVDVDSEDNGSSNDTTVIKKGKINTTTLNVRSEASASSSKIGTLSKGTIVEIVKIEKNGWYKIKYKKGYGYISGSYVVDVDTDDESDRVYKNPPGYIQLKDKISVSGAGKNLVRGTMGLRVAKVQRKLGMGHVWEIVGPTTISKVMAFQRTKGLKVTGVVDLTTWKKMGFSESSWYTLDSYVTPVKTNSKSTRSDLVEQMIRTAESYLGTEYVVGAAGVPGSGIDCSGLVMQAMYSIGIDPAPVSVTRHTQPGYEYESRNLWNLPTLKTVQKPQRGDLVFYKNSAGTIIHVAIYLGNNRVIEAWPEKVVNWPLIHPERPLIKGYKRVLG